MEKSGNCHKLESIHEDILHIHKKIVSLENLLLKLLKQDKEEK